MTAANGLREKIEWKISVPVFRNSTIVKQLGLAIGIPFGLIIVILLLVTKASIYALYALGLIAALFLFTYLLIRVLWGGKYEAGFVLDSKGIRCYTQESQRRKNRVLNALTVVLGLLSGKPAAAGAGLLAQTRQDILVRWQNIRKVKYCPKQHTIMIRGGFAENIAIFCSEDNYAEVEIFVKHRLEKTHCQ